HEVVSPGPDPLRIAEDDDRAPRQAVHQELERVLPVEQRRRERLHTLHGNALGQLVEHLAELRVLPREIRCALAYVLGEQQLPARRRPEPVNRLDRALVSDGEAAYLLDLVAPELDAQRVVLGGREDVENATAD